MSHFGDNHPVVGVVIVALVVAIVVGVGVEVIELVIVCATVQ